MLNLSNEIIKGIAVIQKFLNPLLNISAQVALHLSSAFFISLLILLVYPDRNLSGGTLFNIAMIVLIVFLYAAKKFKKLDDVLLWIGSVMYFVFLSGMIFEWSLLGSVYETYGKKIEQALNQVLVGVVLFVIAVAIIGFILLKAYAYLTKLAKGTQWQTLADIVGVVFFISFISIFYIDEVFPALNPMQYAIDQAHYFIPFLGFSLAYLHGQFLVSSIMSLFASKTKLS